MFTFVYFSLFFFHSTTSCFVSVKFNKISMFLSTLIIACICTNYLTCVKVSKEGWGRKEGVGKRERTDAMGAEEILHKKRGGLRKEYVKGTWPKRAQSNFKGQGAMTLGKTV